MRSKDFWLLVALKCVTEDDALDSIKDIQNDAQLDKTEQMHLAHKIAKTIHNAHNNVDVQLAQIMIERVLLKYYEKRKQ